MYLCYISMNLIQLYLNKVKSKLKLSRGTFHMKQFFNKLFINLEIQ